MTPREDATRQEEPVRDAPSPAWPALLLAIVLILPAATPRPAHLGWALALGVALALTVALRARWIAVAALLVAGIGLRVAFTGVGSSDVLTVTVAAAEQMLAGGNPYGVGYEVSRPPGAPFPYGPLALVWYLPALAFPVAIELAASFLVLGALALRGRPYGLALYAAAPVLFATAGDGSNDTSAGLLLLLALLAARRSAVIGGALLALAVAFKPFAAAWLPPLVAWSGLPAVVGFALGSLATWGPALVAFGPGSIAASLRRAQEIHPTPFYSLAAVVEGVTARATSQAAFDTFRLLAGTAVAIAGLPFARSWDRVIVTGAAIYLVTLYTGYWATFAYFAALGPIVCWRLDDWVGVHGRVRWPFDPAGRLTRWLDGRWPPRR